MQRTSSINSTPPIDSHENHPPITDMGIGIIDKFIADTKDIFTHKDLKNLQRTNPALSATVSQYEKLQELLCILRSVQLGTVESIESIKKESQNVYDNFPGWNIGTDLSRCLDLINLLKDSFFQETQTDLLAKDDVKYLPLENAILDLKKYGDTLLKSDKAVDKAYGKASALLAIELQITIDRFFAFNNKSKDPAEQKKFQERFMKLIECKKTLLSEHPDHALAFKQYLRNIAKALLIVCSLIGIPIYIAKTKQNPFKLFCKPKTEARKLLDNIENRKVM